MIREAFQNYVPSFIEMTTGISIALGLRYLFFAGLAWLLGYVIFKRRWIRRKIVEQFPKSSDMRRDMAYSALSVFIFGIVAAATIAASRQGWNQLYWDIGKYGWGWFWGSVLCAVVLHDTYFYWTHRMMHHPRLFRHFHRVHHLSHNPSPWASYAFGPLEAIVQAGIFPLAAFVMPVHPLAFALFMLWQFLNNVIGHTGYEIYPRKFMDTWISRVVNTPTNHIMHHEKMRGNYGLYFNVWDRLMGTNHEDYEKRFREVTSRPKVGRSAAVSEGSAAAT